MTRDDIIATLHKIEHAQQDRIEVWRDVIDMDGRVIQRIYRGSFQRPRDPQTRASQNRGE